MNLSRLCLVAILLPVVSVAAQDRRGPFTHPPRSVRSRDVDQENIRLELSFNWERQEMQGRAVHRMTAFKSLSSITLDAADMKITSVKRLTGQKPLKFRSGRNKLHIDLDRTYEPGDPIELDIRYVVVKPRAGVHFVVPDDDEPGQLQMVWTQSEPEFARYWFPCIDSPADRITSEIIATVPSDYYVLSNGSLLSKKMNDDKTQTWHWMQRKTHVPYLMSVVAGEFEVYEQEWDGIPIRSLVPKGRLDDAARSFDKTAGMMKFFSEKIGYRYPWPKYSQICVDEYGWGGMEHTSATTLNIGTLHDKRAHLDVSSVGLVAHELAHQWFGDLITCKDWGELWLNESFATYFDSLWTEHDKGWDEATWQRYEDGESYKNEDKRYRRPIVTYRYNAPGNMFDRHSYPKGARVLHMLRFELGDELFWKAIRRYTTVNQFRNVETADLRIAIEDATGRGMNWFFDQWLHHGGHPDFEVAWDYEEKTKTVQLVVKQTQKVDEMTPLFRTSAEIAIALPNKLLERRITLSKAEETFHFEVAERPTRVCFDPKDWILKTLKFEKSKEELLNQLENSQHMMCQVRAAQALAEFTKHEDVRKALIRAGEDHLWMVRLAAVKSLAKFSGKDVSDALNRFAKSDIKPLVRREVIKSLARFPHKDIWHSLDHVLVFDPSYYCRAEALRTSFRVDRKNCADRLLAALKQDSHRHVILKAAVNGLVELRDERAEPRLREMLTESITPSKRIVVVSGLARLKPDDEEIAELLQQQLDDERSSVRRAAIEALTEIGGADSTAALRDRRAKELSLRTIARIDEAIERIQAKQNETDKLRKELDSLRKQNQSLEQRLRKLEETSPPN